jgi:hypothetical protein
MAHAVASAQMHADVQFARRPRHDGVDGLDVGVSSKASQSSPRAASEARIAGSPSLAIEVSSS